MKKSIIQRFLRAKWFRTNGAWEARGNKLTKNAPIPFYANVIICLESGWLFSLREDVAGARAVGLSHRAKNTRLNEAETGRARFSRALGEKEEICCQPNHYANCYARWGTAEFDYLARVAVIQSVIKEV